MYMTSPIDGSTNRSEMSCPVESSYKIRSGFTIPTRLIRNDISITDWAYLAGFYDGEGTITATTQKRKDRDYYQLRFMVNNTNYELLRGLQNLFGGAIHVGSVMKDKPNWKQIYSWHAESKATCLPIFYGMLPFLRYKRREIELAIEYWEGVVPCQRGSLSDNEIERRYRIVKDIQSLPGRRKYRQTSLPAEVLSMMPTRV
jgi:hypothetical protein